MPACPDRPPRADRRVGDGAVGARVITKVVRTDEAARAVVRGGAADLAVRKRRVETARRAQRQQRRDRSAHRRSPHQKVTRHRAPAPVRSIIAVTGGGSSWLRERPYSTPAATSAAPPTLNPMTSRVCARVPL